MRNHRANCLKGIEQTLGAPSGDDPVSGLFTFGKSPLSSARPVPVVVDQANSSAGLTVGGTAALSPVPVQRLRLGGRGLTE